MNSKKIKKIFIILIFGFIIWISSKSTQAAYVSVSPSTTSANPKETVTLTISSDCIGRVNLSASNGSLSANSVFIDGSQTVNVVVGNSGTTVVTAIPVDMSDSNGTTVSVKESTTSISIKNASSGTTNNDTNPSTKPNTPATTEKSFIATLSNLGIRPNDFSGFKANIYSYNVEVPNDVEKIQVYANKGQSGQQISGTGTKTLKEGKNSFSIVVTAEDGKTQKTYTVNVTRKQKEEVTEPITEQENLEENSEEIPMEEIFGLSELKIEGIELQPEFQTEVYEYRIELKEDLDKLDLTTLATEVGADIEITGNENLHEGENIITIIVKGESEANTVAYQIIVNKVLENNEDILKEEQENKEKVKKIIIISLSGGILFVIIMVIIIIKVRKSRNISDNYIAYENIVDSYSDDYEANEQIEKNEYESYEKYNKKKKRSKGKRFK